MKTVFVIGAGANVEIGMPSGNELKKEIAERLDFSSMFNVKASGSINIYSALQEKLNGDNQMFNIASTIEKAMPYAISIDSFIDAHRNEPDIALAGKFAIIESIMMAENKSYLNDYLKKGKREFLSTWYPLFFRKINEGCDINEFVERLNDVSFIIFNYDRCFEFFMIYALDAYYKVGKINAKNIVEKMSIIHPYGKIGNIDEVPLDTTINAYGLMELSNNIRTFAEGSDETKKERSAIKSLIDNANRIIFLGFAYHPMNLDLLFERPSAGHTVMSLVQCYGTGFGISQKDREHIQYLLKSRDNRLRNSEISGDTCTQFFNNFWHRLSFK
jgi:hypothetical protein